MPAMYKGQSVFGVMGGGSGEVYSTEETRIGTWIDGKPLYRKTFKTISPTASTNAAKIIGIEDLHVDTVSGLRGIVEPVTGQYLPAPYFYSNDYTVYLVVRGETYNGDEKNSILCQCGSGDQQKPLVVTLEYTKTTDQATIEIPALAELSSLTTAETESAESTDEEEVP